MNNAKTRADSGPAVALLQVNPGGFGFAKRLDGGGSIFIPNQDLGLAIDGDEVEVDFWPAPRGDQGRVIAVRTRGRTRLTGILKQAGRHWLLEGDDPRILPIIELADSPGRLEANKVVVAAILQYPEPGLDRLVVRVERILGDPDKLATEQLKILITHGIDPVFSAAVEAEAAEVPRAVREVDLEGRDDLRDLPFMTIDPEDARDFDDAVCVEPLGGDDATSDMRLHIAVADVSHYVREGTEIDREAAIRCFSTYLPNQAIPMLPEALSSHICSLVPREDRLAMVASMRLDPAGEVSDVQLRAAVIHSQRRLTYGQVADELAGDEQQSDEVRRRIFLLRKAADRLRARRLRRGAIELDLPESRVVLDEDDPERIRDIVPSRSSREMIRAYNLIEEFMLAANEAVAREAVTHRLPMVFRIHDTPAADKLEQLARAGEALGIPVDPDKLTKPRGVQKLLGKLKNHPRRQALNMLMLRAMAQAEYSTKNVGHFALASDAYAHFTSPIRRYPDVLVHRVLKAHLSHRGGKAGPAPVPRMPDRRDSQAKAERSSERERAAMQAERDSRSLYAAAFMRDRLGDRFEGTISGITSNGVFVSIDHPAVDGMIKTASLGKSRRDHYELDEAGVRLTGKRSGDTLTLGDRVIVEAIDASLQRRWIELALIDRLRA